MTRCVIAGADPLPWSLHAQKYSLFAALIFFQRTEVLQAI